MKWWFLFFLRGVSLNGPYDTEQACLAALKEALDVPILDQGSDGAATGGVCFRGSQPPLKR